MDDVFSVADLFEAAGRYGYRHPSFAEAYAEVGEVRYLRRSGAWLLTRAIPGSERADASVGHPLLICRDPRALADDLTETAALADIVTLSALSDPLAPVDEPMLREAFPDMVRVHARHFVVDLPTFWPSREHRRAVRRAAQLIEIDIEESPVAMLDAWGRLSPAPGGVAPTAEPIALSRAAQERQLAVPGCVGITASADDGPVASMIVYLAGEDAHIHAVASSAHGDELGALYALYAAAAEDMVGRGLSRLDLGTAAGAAIEAGQDAARFMVGWTDLTLPAYRCGRIIDRVAYDALNLAAGTTGSAVFPAYRDGGHA